MSNEFFYERNGRKQDRALHLPLVHAGDVARGLVPPLELTAAQRARMHAVVMARRPWKDYDPNQPRDPSGTSTGGQWTGGSGTSKVDLKTLKAAFTLRGRGYATPEDEEALVRRYNEHVGVPPEQLIKVMLTDLKWRPDGYGDLPTLTLHESGGVTFRAALADGGSIGRTINGKAVIHEEFFLEKKLQKADIAKKVLQSQMAFYKEQGIEKITLTTFKVGGYAWAKYGFAPEQKSWDRLRKASSKKTTDAALLKILASDDPKAIWKLADTEGGKKLLLGKKWKGELKLSDEDAMARFEKYIGKKK